MHIKRDMIIAALVGLIILGIAHIATWHPGFYSTGFPIDYSYYDCRVCGCYRITAGSACRTYNPLLVGLDYLLYAGIAFAVIIFIDIKLRKTKNPNHNHPTAL